MSSKAIHILQMGKHFLYLPIYYAEQRNFFGFLPEGWTVVIDEPISEGTDTATYDQMMSDEPRYRDFVMAITDPVQILRTDIKKTNRKPAVLATLVTNGGFWAVNHGSHQIDGFRSLGSFDRVIAYNKGTTSYSIAARLASETGQKKPLEEFIQVVSPGNELLVLSGLPSGANTVALSPNILEIEEMEGEGKAKNELALGGTHEYNDMIVTALVSTSDFVAKNPEVVHGILKGLQHALNLTRRLDPDFLTFAKSYFYYPEKVESAIAKAKEAGTIPVSIFVEEPHWMNAAKLYMDCDSPDGRWSESEEKLARTYHKQCIKPHEPLVRGAIAELESPQKASGLGYRLMGVKIVLGAIILIAMTALLGWRATIILSASWAFGFAATIFPKDFVKRGVVSVCAVAGIVITVLPVIPAFNMESKFDLLFPLGIGLVLFAAPEFLNYVKGKKPGTDRH